MFNIACATLCLSVFLTTTFALSLAFETEPREPSIHGNFDLLPFSPVAKEMVAKSAAAIRNKDSEAARQLCREVHMERRARRIRLHEYQPLQNLVCHNASKRAWKLAKLRHRHVLSHIEWTSSTEYTSAGMNYIAAQSDEPLELEKVYDTKEVGDFFGL